MERYGVTGTARVSFGLYNTAAEVDHCVAALARVVSEARGRKAVTLPLAGPEPAYPAAAGASPREVAEELAETFELFDDWQDRYHYILELGEKLPHMPTELKTEPNRVHGCQSIVYLSSRVRPGTADVVEFLADSNADLVRGLIAVLERLFSGQRAGDILSFDVEGFFARLGLDQHLTLGRRNGLAAMVQRVRNFAASVAGHKE
jgi:cysteine desulfurase/selenocysteine lyase